MTLWPESPNNEMVGVSEMQRPKSALPQSGTVAVEVPSTGQSAQVDCIAYVDEVQVSMSSRCFGRNCAKSLPLFLLSNQAAKAGQTKEKTSCHEK
jgi:hypothetical protein